MAEVNEGVQIILNRMESNPEEFFGDSHRWAWMFKENMREVMTEQEKAAIHEGMMKVRRLEITAKAAATVLRANEANEREKEQYAYDSAIYPHSGVLRGATGLSFTNTANTMTSLTVGTETLDAATIKKLKDLL